MKLLPKISILLNLGLIGLVIFLLAGKPKSISPAAPLSAAEAVAQTKEPAPTPLPQSLPQPSLKSEQPFRWSRLEATDYPTYIANLRRIECPEQTIRDIIAADVDAAIYASRREQLEQKAQNSRSSVRYEEEAQKLNNEETAMIASLLGLQVAADTTEKPADEPIVMPLVFQNVAPSGLNTNEFAVITALRQRFMKEIGSQEDPNDPAYRERWKKAQASANSRLEGMIGLRAYQAYELKARVAALAQTSAAGEKP